jgi:phage protein D
MPRKVTLKIIYENRDVTKALENYLISLTYTDSTEKADTLSLELYNENKEFSLTSYPTPDAEISAFIDGYPCGKFRIDSVRRTLYTFSIEATAIKRTSEIHKTKRNRNFQNTTLPKVVTQIAKENGLVPVVKVEDIAIENLQQNQQTDAALLKNLADRWNCYLKIQPDKLFFVERDEFENQEPIATITENQLIEIELEDQVYSVFRSCTVYYHDPLKNRDLSYTYVLKNVPVGEEIKLHEKVETLEQAKKRAIAELKKRNRWRTSGTITVEGNMSLVAGAVVRLELKDLFTGNYLIEESSHRVDASGYQTTLTVRRVG